MSKTQLGVKGIPATSAIACLAVMMTSIAAPVPQSEAPKFELTSFYMVVLNKGPKWEKGIGDQQLVQAHLKHVQGLLASGKAAVMGPFVGGGPIAGVGVFNASSAEEARSFEEPDPFVKAGLLSIEVLKWWAAKGVMKPPRQPSKLIPYYFTFLRRGPKWTAASTPETQKLQADHLANINAMARTGKLVIAGPFENGGDYAGVFVFKVGTLDEAKAMAASDPAIKAGRLIADVYPWMIAEGSLP